jgi:hypothetical protein
LERYPDDIVVGVELLADETLVGNDEAVASFSFKINGYQAEDAKQSYPPYLGDYGGGDSNY